MALSELNPNQQLTLQNQMHCFKLKRWLIDVFNIIALDYVAWIVVYTVPVFRSNRLCTVTR
jgi:hypothetical protein